MIGIKRIRAAYDAAQTTQNNEKHWLQADALTADEANSPFVRQLLVRRSRYETTNNCYAQGMVDNLVSYTLGTGPKIDLSPKSPYSDEVEKAYNERCEEIQLFEKLYQAFYSRIVDGESFTLFYNDPELSANEKLNFTLIETERISGEGINFNDPYEVDGIYLDKVLRPKKYRVLKYSPYSYFSFKEEAEIYSASQIHHFFSPFRIGQHRGVPELLAALPLFAYLRRYTLAVVAAAETGANFSGVLYTDSPASGEAQEIQALENFELERNMLLTLPEGWKMGQVNVVQPTNTYPQFKKEILCEIGRPSSVPYNITSGSSAEYNYSSSRMDFQQFSRKLKKERKQAQRFLTRDFNFWYEEYLLNNWKKLGEKLTASWLWDADEEIDPLKEANALKTMLEIGMTSLRREYAKRGMNFDEEKAQIEMEKEWMKKLSGANNENIR